MVKPLIIIGTGRCIWGDFSKAKELVDSYDVMLVNHIIYTFPENAKHFCTLHPDWYRSYRGHWQGREVPHQHFAKSYPEIRAACSGLFATWVGITLGYDRIMLVGMPMDDSGHYYDPPDHKGCYAHYLPMMAEWQQDAPLWHDKVKSFAGKTKQWLGEPTEEWLYGLQKRTGT